MSGSNLTASGIVSFAQKLEDRFSAFYEELAERFSEQEEVFLAYAKKSRKSKTFVTRTYQETVTDALEVCFSFEGLNLGDYAFEPALTEDADYSEALERAIEWEEKARQFYLDVAECSESLLATIPMTFRRVAKERDKRRQKLQSLLDER
jgi:rubrerythrin